MYVLIKQENRAETTDTILILASNDYAILEEIMLSLFDELLAHEMEWANREEYDNERAVLEWCISRMSCYQIIRVMYLED